jgi:hypothetical protein
MHRRNSFSSQAVVQESLMTKKKFLCPHCGKEIKPSDLARFIGAKGGSAGTGDKKRRTSEQARAASNARWAKARAKDKDKPDFF